MPGVWIFTAASRAVSDRLNAPRSNRQISLCPWPGKGGLAAARDSCNSARRRKDVSAGVVEIE